MKSTYGRLTVESDDLVHSAEVDADTAVRRGDMSFQTGSTCKKSRDTMSYISRIEVPFDLSLPEYGTTGTLYLCASFTTLTTSSVLST